MRSHHLISKGFIHSSLILCISIVMAACSTPINLNKVSGPFPGVNDIMVTGDMTQLLIIHGMGDHKVGYSSPLRQGLEKALDLGDIEYKGLKTIRVPGSDLSYAFLKAWDYKSKQHGSTLRVYELTWSPVTRTVKEITFSEDFDLNVYRQNLNAALKEFVNDYLSDPFLYLGKYGDNILYVVEQALCEIMKDTPAGNLNQQGECNLNQANTTTANSGNIAIVSHSLGSKIVYDALYSLNEKAIKKEKIQKNTTAKTLISSFIGRIHAVYMMANQITFLGLANIDQTSDTPSKTFDSFGNVMKILSGQTGARQPIHIVAFTDPNDMLSYPLPEGYCKKHSSSQSARCTNVLVSNNASSLFGQLSNPVTAHTRYDENKDVIRLIACGTNQHSLYRCSYEDKEGPDANNP